MAINKAIQTSHGITASYHRIVSLQILFDHKMAIAQIGSYPSKEERDNGFSPLSPLAEVSAPISDPTKDVRGEIYSFVTRPAVTDHPDGGVLSNTSIFADGTEI